MNPKMGKCNCRELSTSVADPVGPNSLELECMPRLRSTSEQQVRPGGCLAGAGRLDKSQRRFDQRCPACLNPCRSAFGTRRGRLIMRKMTAGGVPNSVEFGAVLNPVEAESDPRSLQNRRTARSRNPPKLHLSPETAACSGAPADDARMQADRTTNSARSEDLSDDFGRMSASPSPLYAAGPGATDTSESQRPVGKAPSPDPGV